MGQPNPWTTLCYWYCAGSANNNSRGGGISTAWRACTGSCPALYTLIGMARVFPIEIFDLILKTDTAASTQSWVTLLPEPYYRPTVTVVNWYYYYYYYYYYYTWVLLWWRCRTTAAGPPYNVSVTFHRLKNSLRYLSATVQREQWNTRHVRESIHRETLPKQHSFQFLTEPMLLPVLRIKNYDTAGYVSLQVAWL